MSQVTENKVIAAPVPMTPLQEFWHYFKRNKGAVVGLVYVVIVLFIAIFANWIAPYNPAEQFRDALLAPPAWQEGGSMAHLLGTDDVGRDVLSRLMYGARLSLLVGCLVVVLSLIMGVILGLIAGFYEGWPDRIIMRISDVLFAFPGILLAIGIVAILGGGMLNVVAAVAIFSIPAFARLVRANVLSLKTQTYVEAARSLGISDTMLLFRHILPGTISSIVVYFSMRIGTSIITAASLSFLGLGAQPPTPEWGAMLNAARADMVNAPHIAIIPSIAIFLTVLAFNLLGDGLRDALDPKIDRQ